MTNETDYIPRQAVIDPLHYYADEACSAIVADVERIPGASYDHDQKFES